MKFFWKFFTSGFKLKSLWSTFYNWLACNLDIYIKNARFCNSIFRICHLSRKEKQEQNPHFGAEAHIGCIIKFNLASFSYTFRGFPSSRPTKKSLLTKRSVHPRSCGGILFTTNISTHVQTPKQAPFTPVSSPYLTTTATARTKKTKSQLLTSA